MYSTRTNLLSEEEVDQAFESLHSEWFREDAPEVGLEPLALAESTADAHEWSNDSIAASKASGGV